MNRQKLISQIKQEYMLKRIHAQEECENFIENLRKNDEFNAIYSDFLQKQLNFLKNSYEFESEALKNDVEILRAKIEKYLEDNNIDKSKLKPKYECPICEDTGVANGKICSCLISSLNKKVSELSSSISDYKTFADADFSIMNDIDKKAFEVLKAWCEKYPDVSKINVNIIGKSGSGKTFLLECVADALMKKNVQVTFKTAFELNELARLYHMGKSYEFSDCLRAEVLFIDDLGTEPVLKNVTKEYLYNLINVRQMNNLPTFISTNLSLDNILIRYDERILSRLANKSLSININLTSEDKRLK